MTSTLAAGIWPDACAGEAGEGEGGKEEMTGGYFYCSGWPFLSTLIGKQAKRARRYLVMSMEARDIYIYSPLLGKHGLLLTTIYLIYCISSYTPRPRIEHDRKLTPIRIQCALVYKAHLLITDDLYQCMWCMCLNSFPSK